LSARQFVRLLLPPALFALAACASGPVHRTFGPATAEDAREALDAWSAAQARADALPASRLLYDAHMGKGSVAPVPGTMAVTYDGSRVVTANLTGPFGARIADYAQGTVSGKDEHALVIDPDALRSVLAGVWSGAPARVAGRDGTDCLLVWDGAYRVEAVLDVTEKRLRSLAISGSEGRLDVMYSGSASPWPERVAVRDQKSGRSLSLALLAVEPAPAEGKPRA
jgi:hypothetical protein